MFLACFGLLIGVCCTQAAPATIKYLRLPRVLLCQNNKVKLSNDERASLLNYSGLSITINHVRGFIAALTSYAPFGRYNLPTIDVNSLLSQKKDQLDCDLYYCQFE